MAGNLENGSPIPFTAGQAQQVKTVAGAILGFFASTAGTVDLYDGTGTAGTHVGVALPVAAGWNPMPFCFANAIYVALTTAAGTLVVA
jgi:hypothetical protein